MSLNEFLVHKRKAVLARDQRITDGEVGPSPLHAKVTAEGRTGLRRMRIRDHQIISDSANGFAGYDLGPSSPELQLGVLGTCMVHIFEIQAAAMQVPLDSVEVDVWGSMDARAGTPGFESLPRGLQGIRYEVRLGSPASDLQIDALYASVESTCPILSLLRNPQEVHGQLVRV
ncbi:MULTISPECIES: OsmC family protein [unclassified Comamonas]|uniref:OsmC family protein n=1 Tax=unclassified Comamonas TaxID=2638500 RepID=UPI00105CA7FB|nr:MULTISPECIES: OsmC family protein [unclassified Comamonas]TDS73603.1 putative OsmC-like protein [Comamonas sp. JUb58]